MADSIAFKPDKNNVDAIIKAALAQGRTSLTAPEGKAITDAYGIPTPGEALAESADDAVAVAARIGFPVAMKIVSPEILHKTDAGGVQIGVGSAAEVRAAFTTIVSNARAYDPNAQILGVQVQQMVPAGTEILIGTVTDPTFGKVVAFGLGGVLVEVLKDVTFRLAPATKDDALSMLDGIRARRSCAGYGAGRGRPRRAGRSRGAGLAVGRRLPQHRGGGPQSGLRLGERGHGGRRTDPAHR